LFGIGGWEFFIVAVLALLLFGPDKLPEFARTIGRFTRDFKRYKDLMESTLRAEIYTSDLTPSDPFKKGKEFREKVQSGEVAGLQQGGEPGTQPAESTDSGTEEPPGDETGRVADVSPGEDSDSEAEDERRGGLPPGHPLSDAYAAGEDIGLDEDLDLSTIDPADLGWVPGRSGAAEEVDGDEG